MENQHIGTEQPAPASESQLAAISFQPPRFWKADPKNWFELVEIQFTAAKITSETTQLVRVVSSLDETVLQGLDIASLRQDKAPYSALKKDLVARFAVSTEAKLATLLAGIQLADRRPTEFLRQIRSLAGSDATDAMLRAVFTQQMPTTVRQILASSTAPLNELAILADKILDVSSANEVAAIQQQYEPKHQHVPRSQSQSRGRGRGRGNGRSHGDSRQRSKSRNRTGDHVCYYHVTFGAKARKCDLDNCLLKHLLTKSEN